MSYASGTTHYNLPQTVGSDKRDWTDTNQAFSDIDAAIYGAAQGASAATSAIETINGEIETITGKQAVDEGNISTLSGKVSTLESTVGTQGAAIADVRQDLQDNIESKREASATSTHAYNIGDTFYYNDVLYKATAQIAIGGTIVPSTNCTAVTVMSELQTPSEPEYVEITTTASDTYGSIMSRLFAAADMTKVTSASKIWLSYAGGYTMYRRTKDQYFTAYCDSASFVAQTGVLAATGKFYQYAATGGAAGTVTDLSANNVAVGTIRLYY